jgi:uncharacterized delta-60 repeat protein
MTVQFDLGGDNQDHGRALAIQPDGKIVLAGFAELNGGDYDFAVARLLADGSLDSGFAGVGKAVYGFNLVGGDTGDFARAVAVQPDGKIVVAGQASYDLAGSTTFAVLRLLPDGQYDPGFGSGGKTAITFGTGTEYATAVAIQPNGKIVLAGVAVSGANYQFGAVRLNANGTLDTSFSGDGKQTIGFDLGGGLYDAASDVVIQPDGKIVLVGEAEQTGGSPLGGKVFAVARLLGNGTLDNTFNNDGKVTYEFNQDHRMGSVALRPGGEILLAGSVYYSATDADFLVVQFDSNGFLDLSFNGGGYSLIAFDVQPGMLDFARDLAIESDGRIVVVGSAQVQSDDFDFAIAHLDAAGGPAQDYFQVRVPFNVAGGVNDAAHGVALQNDGKIVVAGLAEFANPDFDFAVVRLFGSSPLFADGFESGNTFAWSLAVP